MSIQIIKTCFILLLLLTATGILPAAAADWSVVPSIEQRSEFNSNLNYSFGRKSSDYIFTAKPQLDLNYATEITLLQARLQATPMHYITYSNLDKIDQNYQINAQHQLTSRWNLFLTSSYITDSTLQEELTTSGLFMNRTLRTAIQVGPGMNYALTERLLATANYNFYQVGYEDPQFRSYTTQGVNLGFNYLLSNEKTTLRESNSISETRYSNDDTIRSLSLALGLIHKFSETWEASVLGGLNFNETRTLTALPDISNFPFITIRSKRIVDSLPPQPYFDISTVKTWETGSVRAGYVRSQSPSSGGTLQEINRLYASLNYRFTEKLTGNVGSYISLSKTATQDTDRSTTYLGIAPTIIYSITEKFSISPGYRFGIRGQSSPNQSTDQHLVFLSLNYSYPIHTPY